MLTVGFNKVTGISQHSSTTKTPDWFFSQYVRHMVISRPNTKLMNREGGPSMLVTILPQFSLFVWPSVMNDYCFDLVRGL